MRHIIVKSCEECKKCFLHRQVAVGEIHRECPLIELPDRETARGIIHDYAANHRYKDDSDNDEAEDEALDRLGFK
jgi:hypothetical protein